MRSEREQDVRWGYPELALAMGFGSLAMMVISFVLGWILPVGWLFGVGAVGLLMGLQTVYLGHQGRWQIALEGEGEGPPRRRANVGYLCGILTAIVTLLVWGAVVFSFYWGTICEHYGFNLF